MAEPVGAPWTTDEFFVWQELQAERYELVDGEPLKMMAGANSFLRGRRHGPPAASGGMP